MFQCKSKKEDTELLQGSALKPVLLTSINNLVEEVKRSTHNKLSFGKDSQCASTADSRFKNGSSHKSMVKLSLIMVPRLLRGERFQQMMLGQLDSQMKRVKLDPYHIMCKN